MNHFNISQFKDSKNKRREELNSRKTIYRDGVVIIYFKSASEICSLFQQGQTNHHQGNTRGGDD